MISQKKNAHWPQNIYAVKYLVSSLVLTFYLFQMVINFQKCLVKLGLLHLISTNICIWIFTIVLEASASYVHVDYLIPDINNLPITSNDQGLGLSIGGMNESNLNASSKYKETRQMHIDIVKTTTDQ